MLGTTGQGSTTRLQNNFLVAVIHLFVFQQQLLGHHALEMYLKAVLICEGMTVFNPVILKSLDPGIMLTRANCIWGHRLVDLAERLGEKRKDFKLDAEMDIHECRTLLMPMTLRAGFALLTRSSPNCAIRKS